MQQALSPYCLWKLTRSSNPTRNGNQNASWFPSQRVAGKLGFEKFLVCLFVPKTCRYRPQAPLMTISNSERRMFRQRLFYLPFSEASWCEWPAGCHRTEKSKPRTTCCFLKKRENFLLVGLICLSTLLIFFNGTSQKREEGKIGLVGKRITDIWREKIFVADFSKW